LQTRKEERKRLVAIFTLQHSAITKRGEAGKGRVPGAHTSGKVDTKKGKRDDNGVLVIQGTCINCWCRGWRSKGRGGGTKLAKREEAGRIGGAWSGSDRGAKDLERMEREKEKRGNAKRAHRKSIVFFQQEKGTKKEGGEKRKYEKPIVRCRIGAGSYKKTI